MTFPLRIAILLYPGCMGTHVFGISEILRMGSAVGRKLHPHKAEPFSVRWVSVQGGVVHIAGGIGIPTVAARGAFDLVVVPGMELDQPTHWDARLHALQKEVTYLRKVFSKGVGVASVCVGAFLLAQAQLLQGRRATTSWLFADDLAQRAPTAYIVTESMIVEDSGITTTGAVSAGFDLAIHLLKRTWGADVAAATARIASLPSNRTSQLPFVDAQLKSQPVAPFSQQVAQWLESHLTEPFDLERLADAFCVSTSTLLRRIKSETAKTPLGLLQEARVQRARRLLETTTWSLERITEAVGYSDLSSFTRLFVRFAGDSPARYRQRHR